MDKITSFNSLKRTKSTHQSNHLTEKQKVSITHVPAVISYGLESVGNEKTANNMKEPRYSK